MGAVATATTLQLVITGENLNGAVTLTATTPFSFAGGQTHEITPTSGSINTSIDVIFTPSNTAQAHTSAITISGGGLSPNVEIDLIGVSVPALADSDGDNLLEIRYIEQLNLVRNGLDEGYELLNNLDFTSDDSYASGAVNLAYRPLNNTDPASVGATKVANVMGLNPGFTPIGTPSARFTGTFDGRNFTISNLYINTTAINVGLFGITGAGSDVKNLGLLDVYVKGSDNVGGVVGGNFSNISNCYITTGTVSGSNRIGGLVGNNFSGNIRNCYATGNVTGESRIGGLVGTSSSNISNCYATGAVTGTGSGDVYAGGLVGKNFSTIINCYAAGTVTATGGSGLVGENNGTIRNCYATGGSGLVETNNGSITNSFRNTTTQLQMLIGDDIPADITPDATTIQSGWGELNWDFGNNTQYPTLRSYEASENSQVQGFVICHQPATTHVSCNTTTISLRGSPVNFGEIITTTTLQLVITGRNLSGEITLSDLTAPFAYAAGQAPTLAVGSSGFVSASIPITLTPTTDYQTHTSTITISGGGLSPNVEIDLTGFSIPALTDTDDNDLLEIKYIEQLSAVRNNLAGQYELTKSLDFANDSHYASGAVNIAYRPLDNTDPTASGAAVVSPVDGMNQGFTPIGNNSNNSNAIRFTGTLEGNNFTISSLYINIRSINDIYAGLFGATGSNSRVQNLGVVGAYIQAEGTEINSVNAGGLMGFNEGPITNCYATGEVIGRGPRDVFAGGLVGENNNGNIRNCYATVNVTADGTGDDRVNTGGLVGVNLGNVENCYATGEASGTGSSANTGGLVGRVGSFHTRGTISNCYATGNVSGTGSSANTGGLVGERSGTNGTINNSFFEDAATDTNTGAITQSDLQALTAGAFESTSNPNGSGWSANDWDFGTTSQYPALRTYKTNDEMPAVQIQGDLICPQPQPRANTGCAASIVLTPTAPAIIISNSYDFGNVRTTDTNPSFTYMLTGSNLTTADLNIQLSGTNVANFSLSQTGNITPTNGTLPSTTITVTFNPTAEQSYEATITHSGAGLASNVILTLTGTGIEPPTPTLTLNPTELTFGNLATNATPATQNYTITGTNLKQNVTLTLTGDGSTAFTITSPANTTLTPTDGAISQAVTITFNPTAEQEYTATINHNSSEFTPPTLSLTGTGTAPTTTPDAGVLGLENIENTNTAIRLSPNPVTDRLYVQGSGILQVQVRNILGTTLLVTEITNSGNINFSTLPAGLYLVSVQSTTQALTQRILKR